MSWLTHVHEQVWLCPVRTAVGFSPRVGSNELHLGKGRLVVMGRPGVTSGLLGVQWSRLLIMRPPVFVSMRVL